MSFEQAPTDRIEIASHVRNARYASSSIEENPNEFLYISGYEECGPLYDLRRQTFPYLTLEMIVRGGGKLVLNERKFDIHPGFCFCTGPDISFHLQSSKTRPLTKYFIAFGHEVASSDIRSNRLYPGFVYTDANPAMLEKWNELILEEGISQSAESAKNVMSLVHVLVRKIRPSSSLPSKPQSANALVERVLREIETNFRELGSLQEIADRLGVTSEHLCRIFKTNDKISPYKILSRRKMEHAYAQLKMTGTPIQEIAYSLGFTDAFHFSRAFKKQYGYPPSVARNEIRRLLSPASSKETSS